MKTRNSLISNSSSTSFVLAIKDGSCECCKKSNHDLIDLLDIMTIYTRDTEYDRTKIHATKKDEIIKYLRLESFNDDEFAQCVDKLNNISSNYELIAFDIDDHDPVWRNMVDGMIETQSAILIWRSE